ncbi:ThiF family adenylyltransferase [Coleofasciculus sp.]|uniref:ThiF family adenylyltransferase n=1 Tax=Coleofasciculus sp. TaxID=3100458 RepID=UPI0039F9ABB9
MNSFVSLTLQERHLQELKNRLLHQDGRERAAYLLCGEAFIPSDPWSNLPRRKYLSFDVLSIPDAEIVSCSSEYITWKTDSFVQALNLAQANRMTVALVHSHPGGFATFSDQDDINEPDLVQLAQNRNGETTRLLSLVLTSEKNLIGRCWINPREYESLDFICCVGNRIQLYYPGRGKGVSFSVFHRQSLAFGKALTQDLSILRVGVVGCGGTGSAVAMLLPKLGVRQIALFDKDVVEESNLNRLHGATWVDAQEQRLKVEVVGRSLTMLGIGVEVKSYQAWIGDPVCRDVLKSCDVVFSCTDDHAGRLLLNRFAYYYLTPVFDMGLAIEVSSSEPPKIQALDGRVTTLLPGCTCLLCREVINPVIARDETLKRDQPDEYERRKAEAYVFGEGNPSPAVVLFTTDVAIMALEEMVHRFQGFRGEEGAMPQKVRKYHLQTDRQPGVRANEYCPVCSTNGSWGRGDVEPFLDQV